MRNKGIENLVLTRRQAGLGLGALVASLFSPLAQGAGSREAAGRELIDRLAHPSKSLPFSETTDTFTFYSNGLPDHEVGVPNEHCTTEVAPQPNVFQIPKAPEAAPRIVPLNGWLFGVLLNGVFLDPSGPFWKQRHRTGWQYEVMSPLARLYLGLDAHNAHVQPNGEYHYHGRPAAVQRNLERLSEVRGLNRRMCLLGYAADGYPIYAPYGPSDPTDLKSPLVALRSGYVLKSGKRPKSGPGKLVTAGTRDYTYDGSFIQDYEYRQGHGHLDQCNGRFGVTDEYPDGTYYYCLTDDFPFIPRHFKGKPHGSFFHMSPATPDPNNPGLDMAVVPAGLTAIFG